MLIKIFGVVIATGKDKELFLAPPVNSRPVTEQTEPVNQVALLQYDEKPINAFQGVNNRKNKSQELFLKTIDTFRDLHPITRAISWPDPGDDIFRRTIARKEILEFDRCAKKGWFDICPIRDLVEELNIIKTNSGGLAYKKLHAIHCAHWENIEKDLIKIIPALVSEVFVGVEFPEDKNWTSNNNTF
ncbi:hypothetical protein MOC16_gp131 [Klebsiella phage vB_KpM_FBKp24]|uniref:Uncharacterized protein n=1 Tax=Klebsiella phage vB_KpM_FBKp24 TaxID=2801834 RepID=A0A7U0J6R1_9CAUD|nr:hypothetical protein MOC16_gp131 [Klebsiella phage vB_KpM_FBKp24]QQV92156.1 hypothetical protein vBKpMFBKp24_282 [Klebsiella phage vB_KpM_FBKp24]